MAAVNFTPISLYYSTTAAAVPSAGNLVAGELALNTLDEKLYFKNSAGTVKLLASNITPIANGGTGQTTASAAFNALSPITTTGDLILGNGTNSATRLPIGANGYMLTSNGTTASWTAAPAAGVTSFQTSLSGLTPSTSTTGAVTLAGTLGTANGGTNLTSFTSGGVVYASSSSALATGSVFNFDGTNVGIGTTSLTAKLNLVSTTAPLLIANTSNANGGYFEFNNGSTAPLYIGFGITLVSGITSSDAALRYSNNLVFSVGTSEKARFTSSGGFVVGTTTDPGAGIIADANGNVRNIPQSGSSKTSSYTLATTDVGEYILLGASGAVVIPDATFATGDVVSIFNNTASTATITCTITTAYIAGTFTDKATMTLAAAGVATILFITGTTCVVSGNVT
jgi:hypothetical protein